MFYQISAGQGPAECENAVKRLTDYMVYHYGVSVVYSYPGYNKGDFRSVKIQSDTPLDDFIGSIKCIFNSPYRPGHKRKNWFVDFSRCNEIESLVVDLSQIRFETFRSSGAGGQNVNKVESGVRLVYPPMGLAIVCTEERSQYQNKQKAIDKLKAIMDEIEFFNKAKAKNEDWTHHNSLVRGNESKVFNFMM